MSVFCRHNRYTAECPICSKGTVLDEGRRSPRRPARPPTTGGGKRKSAMPTPAYRGPYAAAGPYDDGYEVRLERVPGGLRLAEWAEGSLRKRAPALAAADLRRLIEDAGHRGALGHADAERLEEALGGRPDLAAPRGFGRSPGRSGELQDELRVESLSEGRVRVARWILRPNFGWELQDAPVMLPPARYAEALADAARAGVLSGAAPEARL